MLWSSMLPFVSQYFSRSYNIIQMCNLWLHEEIRLCCQHTLGLIVWNLIPQCVDVRLLLSTSFWSIEIFFLSLGLLCRQSVSGKNIKKCQKIVFQLILQNKSCGSWWVGAHIHLKTFSLGVFMYIFRKIIKTFENDVFKFTSGNTLE